MKLKLPITREFKRPETLLPLVPEDDTSQLGKADTCQFEVSTNPGQQGATTYKKQVQILKGDEPLCTLLRWRKEVLKTFLGLNLTVGSKQVVICEALLADTPRTIFQAAVTSKFFCSWELILQAATTPMEQAQVKQRLPGIFVQTTTVNNALKAVVKALCPARTLACVKQF